MKKVVSLILSCCMLFSLISCGKTRSEIESDPNNIQSNGDQNAHRADDIKEQIGPDGSIRKLKANELLLPDSMVYATAQCRLGDKIWVGGAGWDGAVMGYVSLDGEQKLIDLPESCEFVYAMCGVDGNLAVLGGSFPSLYIGTDGTNIMNDNPEGALELMVFDGGELVSTTPLKQNYDAPNMTFKLMFERDGDYYIQARSVIIKVASDGTEKARFALENGRSFESAYLTDTQLMTSITALGAQGSVICAFRLLTLEPEDSLMIEGSKVIGFGAASDGALLANTDDGVFRLSLSDGLGESIFLWEELYLSESFNYIEPDDDGYLFYEPYQGSVFFARYEWLESEPEEIVLATDVSYGAVFSLANEYNRKQDNYHITIKTYDVLEDQNSLNLLRTEVAAGSGPDIFAFTQDESFSEVRSENLYINLYEYLDTDEECNRDHFVPSLLAAMSEQGNLYWLPYRFNITTLTGPRALLGGGELTLRQIEEIDAVKTGEMRVFHSWMTADYLLRWCLKPAISTYIDRENKSCDFDSEGFMQLLEMCKKYAGNVNIVNADMNEQALLMFDNVSNFLRLCALSDLDYCFAGFPGAEGNGSMFQLELRFAISAQSGSQDAAWDFLKFTASEYGQTLDAGSGFSALLPVLEDNIDDAVKNGVSIGFAEYDYSEEEAQEFMDLINSTTVVSSADIVIEDIIVNLASAYFKGEQSVEAAARNIQSRICIYLSEQFG